MIDRELGRLMRVALWHSKDRFVLLVEFLAVIHRRSIGEATLVMELIDGQTGAVMAVVAERRALQPMGSMMMPTNNVSIIGDIKRWSRDAAAKLRTALDKAIVEERK